MSFKRLISIFAAIAVCSFCWVNCNAAKETPNADQAKCEEGKCDPEKSKKSGDGEAKKSLADFEDKGDKKKEEE